MRSLPGKELSIPKALFKWAEKVLRLWCKSWGSPMSAKTWSKGQNSLPSATGMGMPLCTMRVSSPRVFRATVLPPALAPEMMSQRFSGVSVRSMGTTAGAPGSSRWR